MEDRLMLTKKLSLRQFCLKELKYTEYQWKKVKPILSLIYKNKIKLPDEKWANFAGLYSGRGVNVYTGLASVFKSALQARR